MKRVFIPLSRARREFNKILRRIDRGEIDAYVITRNGVPCCEMVKHRPASGAWDSFFKADTGASEDFGRSQEDDDWLNDPPVGREDI